MKIEHPKNALTMLALFAGYGVLFTGLRASAVDWQTGSLFSLWFPAAGLRFAFLWFVGPRWTVAAALSELATGLVLGDLSLRPEPIASLLGIVAPCLMYGLVIGFVQGRVADRSPVLGLSPLPLALAAVTAPLLASLAALPWAVPRAMVNGAVDGPALLTSLLTFTLGDTLGVLIVAPPLIWLVGMFLGKSLPKVTMSRRIAIEVGLAQIAAWALISVMWNAGYGLVLSPAILAAGWTGIRLGRVGGWAAALLAVAIFLPLSDGNLSDVERITGHMRIASLALIGYIAGALSDAQRRVLGEVRRRDRLLYQAERLKTLRGMSVAVIHEVSQPLSTIEIEANNLSDMVTSDRPDLGEIRSVSKLIARKSADLADLIRQLRRFGERDDGVARDVVLGSALRDVRKLVEPVALRRNITLSFPYQSQSVVRGFDVEVRQALLNIVNNAVAASPDGGQVTVRCNESDGSVRIAVTNRNDGVSSAKPGMGLGLIVARSIAEAHGGSIDHRQADAEHIEYCMTLPLVGVGNE